MFLHKKKINIMFNQSIGYKAYTQTHFLSDNHIFPN